MKKITLILVLSLFVQFVSVRSFASIAPPPPTTSAQAGLGGLAVLGFALFGNDKPTAKKTGNEFVDLNNNPIFTSLLKQMAGGSLNTLEILK